MRFLIAVLGLFLCLQSELFSEDGFEMKREQMVQKQLQTRDITNPEVLAAIRNVPRHQFMPKETHFLAYEDRPVPIGYGQTISQPYIVAFMTQVLDLKKSDRVLEIGTGSGYQAAVLGELVDQIYSIEIVPELAERSKNLLKEMGYQNITVKQGDGYQGWPEVAPFDAIIVTAAPPYIPEKLVEQLSENGGRMVIPVGEHYQELVLITKEGDQINKKTLFPVRFVPMVTSP